MSDRLTNFIQLVQSEIVTDAKMSVKFNRNNVYRKDLPAVKDPKYPCIIISYDRNGRDIGTDIELIRLRFTVVSKEPDIPEEYVGYLQDLFHNYQASIKGDTTV